MLAPVLRKEGEWGQNEEPQEAVLITVVPSEIGGLGRGAQERRSKGNSGLVCCVSTLNKENTCPVTAFHIGFSDKTQFPGGGLSEAGRCFLTNRAYPRG